MEKVTIRASSGEYAEFSTMGAVLYSYYVKDKSGKLHDIVIGRPTIEIQSQEPQRFFGATVGRYCNRIAGGSFEIDGNRFDLPKNNAENNLHTGPHGMHASIWTVKEKTEDSVVFTIVQQDKQDGFPGELSVTQTIRILHGGELVFDYKATTTKDTVCSITNHAYFSLGDHSKDVLSTKLQIEADFFTPISENLIPTGEILSVSNTPFDFRELKTISSDIENEDIQLQRGGGYDHNYVLRKKHFGQLTRAALAINEESHTGLEIHTTLPGLQFYSANDSDFCEGKNGSRIGKRFAFCLEPQFFPDSPNKGHFPSPILRVGQVYHHQIIFKPFAC